MPQDWQFLSSITVTASDTTVVVGSFSLDEGDDTIWVDVQSDSPETPWPWSYGIISWQTALGRELGSTKAYTEQAGVVVPIGVGRQPRSRDGSLIYEPRSFNLAWVRKGNPLSLSFSVASGVRTGAPIGEISQGTLGSFVDADSGIGLQLLQVVFPET